MTASYSELRVRTHVIGIERLDRTRWRVSVDGRRMFTFCSEARARNAGRLEARRLDFVAQPRERPLAHLPKDIALAPLAPRAAGRELALHDPSAFRQGGQRGTCGARR